MLASHNTSFPNSVLYINLNFPRNFHNFYCYFACIVSCVVHIYESMLVQYILLMSEMQFSPVLLYNLQMCCGIKGSVFPSQIFYLLIGHLGQESR